MSFSSNFIFSPFVACFYCLIFLLVMCYIFLHLHILALFGWLLNLVTATWIHTWIYCISLKYVVLCTGRQFIYLCVPVVFHFVFPDWDSWPGLVESHPVGTQVSMHPKSQEDLHADSWSPFCARLLLPCILSCKTQQPPRYLVLKISDVCLFSWG